MKTAAHEPRASEIPPDVREYFAKGRRKAVAVEALPGFILRVTFDNGEIRVLDMNENLPCPAFAPLRNVERFNSVYIDSSGAIAWDADPTVDSQTVWSNHIDLCPDSCYLSGKSLTLAEM